MKSGHDNGIGDGISDLMAVAAAMVMRIPLLGVHRNLVAIAVAMTHADRRAAVDASNRLHGVRHRPACQRQTDENRGKDEQEAAHV